MLRLRKKLPSALLRALIAWLLALGLGMPLLCGAGLHFLLPRYVLICAAAALCCAALSLKRRLLPLALGTMILIQIVLFILGRGFFRQTLTLGRALLLLLRDLPLATVLHGDWLCLQLAVYLTLFCDALSSPDIDAALPVTIVAGILSTEWMMGLRHESLYMLPVLPALLLIYAHTYSYQSAPPSHRPRTSPWAVAAAALLLGLSVLIAPPEGAKNPTLAHLADELQEMINDRFFFRQERARYSLESDGWMPLGNHRLGGEPEPNEDLIMQVETSETAYLRGSILDAYTGAYWYDSISARRYYWNAALQQDLRDELTQKAYPLATSLPAQALTVHFASGGASTLFTPQRVRALSTGARMTPYFNLSSEIFITRNLQPGDVYTVSYLPMKATDSGMAALAEQHAALEDPLYEKAVAQYTVLPVHIQQEIYEIAASVTANCATDWQRAVALRDYLRNNFGYTTEVETPPADVDFVAWFLLAEKQGYCTYFASAMTVLSRMAGLPARYVEGYLVKPESGGVTNVHGTNAHAWTEIYLKGLGWVTFDATPGLGDADRSGSLPPPAPGDTPTPQPPEGSSSTPSPTPTAEPPESTPSPTPSTAPEATPTPEPTPTATPQEDAPSPTPQPTEPPTPPEDQPPRLPWLWLLLILALLLLLAWRVRVTEPLYRAAHAGDDAKALLALWTAILQCAALLHSPMRPVDTPLRFAERASKELSIPLHETAEAVSALCYGRHPVRRGALKAAREAYGALYERLSLPQKLLFALKNAASFK